MADSRELTYGIGFESEGLDEIQQELDSIDQKEEKVQVGAGRVSQAFESMGTQGSDAGSKIGASFQGAAEDADDAGEKMRSRIKEIGTSAESLGGAFKTSMGTMLKEGESTAKGLQAGFQGAFAFTEKKFQGFTNTAKKGAQSVGEAFTHPIKTIKDKLGDALIGAGKAADEAKDHAIGAGDAFDEMGSAGAGAGNQVADAMQSALKAIMGLMAIKAVIDLFKDFTSAAIDAATATEQVGAKFDSAFGAGSADAAEWVDNFASATHRSTNEVKGFMAANQGMFTSMNLTGEAAADLSKMATSLGYDIGAALKMDDAEAMQGIQKIIKGNNNALSEYGIQLDDTKVKAAAQAMGIHESIDALDDATLAQVRFNALLAETSDLHQSAAGSVTGVTGVMKALSAMKDNFMSAAGEKFTSVIEKGFAAIERVWPNIEPMLLNLVDILTDGLEQTIPVLETLGENLLPIVADTLGTLLEAGMPLLPIFAQLAGTILPPLASILGEIGGAVLPPLTDIFMTLTESVLMPLMPIVEDLITALLPPFVELLGMVSPVLEMMSPLLSMVGELLVPIGSTIGTFISSLLPPLMTILDTIFTSVLQPLMPVLTNLVGALLPPAAALLGAIAPILGVISPILEAISPVLDIIGGALGIIGDVLGKVIGFLADGVGKVTGFFSKLFGGAKESKKEVEELSGAVTDLGAATEIEPAAVEIPAIEMPAIEPIQVPAIELPELDPPVVPQPDVSALEPLDLPVNDIELPRIETPQLDPITFAVEVPEIPAVDVPPIGAADTTSFSKSVSTAMAGAQTDTQKAWKGMEDTTDKHLGNIGAECEGTFSEIADQSDTMWSRMVQAAEDGARSIVSAFQDIGAAAASVSGANISITGIGTPAQIPHNASGTDHFAGGPTYINENGGEMVVLPGDKTGDDTAVLPEGSKIIPAGKTDQIIKNTTNSKQEGDFAPVFNIEFTGNAGSPEDQQSLLEQIERMVRQVYRECQEGDFDERALNEALTT